MLMMALSRGGFCTSWLTPRGPDAGYRLVLTESLGVLGEGALLEAVGRLPVIVGRAVGFFGDEGGSHISNIFAANLFFVLFVPFKALFGYSR